MRNPSRSRILRSSVASAMAHLRPVSGGAVVCLHLGRSASR